MLKYNVWITCREVFNYVRLVIMNIQLFYMVLCFLASLSALHHRPDLIPKFRTKSTRTALVWQATVCRSGCGPASPLAVSSASSVCSERPQGHGAWHCNTVAQAGALFHSHYHTAQSRRDVATQRHNPTGFDWAKIRSSLKGRVILLPDFDLLWSLSRV